MADRTADSFDLLVIGGGVNGVGIARDAAGRGLSVLLAEAGDLACATSSASSKLIHGGLRYLEHYDFRLVREALGEREVLLASAPHVVRPLRFVLPHDRHLRPYWMIRAGLFLYDHLARRRALKPCEGIDFRSHPSGRPLKDSFRRGFAYSDCWVDDARLVVLAARDAADRGAAILTRTRCLAARREGGAWTATLREAAGGERRLRARALVNATGPWVGDVLRDVLGRNEARRPRLVKGSHIVVPRLYDGDHAYILQNADRRIVFVLPYEGWFSLIGTTDVAFTGDPGRVAIGAEETGYLCAAVARWFRRGPAPGDVVWSFAGVRPLVDDETAEPSAVTRDYMLELEAAGAPLLSVFGGKITTFRRLAEEAMDRLAPFFPAMGPAWTARARLPGGELGVDFDRFAADLAARHVALPPALALRLARAYGSRASRILDGARAIADLGADLGGGLHEREAEYLVGEEWARSAEDILWRRTKLGLHAPPGTAGRIDAWMARR